MKIDGGELFGRMLEREEVANVFAALSRSYIDGIDSRRAELKLNSFDYPLFKLEKQ